MNRLNVRTQSKLVMGLFCFLIAGLSTFSFFQYQNIVESSAKQSVQQVEIARELLARELKANLLVLDKITQSIDQKIFVQGNFLESQLVVDLKFLETALPSIRSIQIVDSTGARIAPRVNRPKNKIPLSALQALQQEGVAVLRTDKHDRVFIGSPLGERTTDLAPYYLVVELNSSHFLSLLDNLRLNEYSSLAISSQSNQNLFFTGSESSTLRQTHILDQGLEPTSVSGSFWATKGALNNQYYAQESVSEQFGQNLLTLRINAWLDPTPLIASWQQGLIVNSIILILIGAFALAALRTHYKNRKLRDAEREQAARLLKENTERFNLATSSAGIGVWEYDLRTQEVRWSQSMSCLYGLPPKQIVLNLNKWQEFVSKEDVPAFQQLFTCRQEHKEGTTQFKIYKKNNSSKVLIQCEFKAFFNDKGELVKVLGINTDITKKKQFETALKEAEDKFRSAFEHAAVGMAVYGTDGKFIKTNVALQKIIGHSSSDLIKMDINELCHPQDLLVDEKLKKDLIANNTRSYQIEKRLIHQDGHVIWVVASVSAVRDTQGALLYFIAQIQDITERKKNEAALIEREHFLRTLSECLPGLVSYWGRDLRCHFANQKYESWTGIPMKKLRGIHKRELLGDELFSQDQPYIIGALRGEAQRYERHTKRSDGSWADTLVHLIPDVLYGHVEGFFSISTDISELKSQQRALENMNQQLVLRTDQAEAASKAKSSFLANMSHEIRTPMNAIMGLMQLMGDTPLSGEQRDYLNKIGSAAEVLLNVINDVLDISRVEANKLELNPSRFMLGSLLQKSVDLFSYRAQEKGIQLNCIMEIGCPSSLVADRLRLAQILNNLLSNALKFTEKGSITLRVKPIKMHQHLEFSVVDTGIGLSQAEINKLFMPFSQVDNSSSRKFGGAGLGLSICKSLTELMGGDIRIKSEVGKGSSFTFWIPNREPEDAILQPSTNKHAEQRTETSDQPNPARWKAAEQAMGTNEPEPTNHQGEPSVPLLLEGMNILIADDHRLNRLVAGEMIKKSGGLITMAINGAEAIEACKTQRFDAILMDLQMPEVDGFEAASCITTMLGKNTPPIIAVTASATEKDRRAVLAAGMCDHIVKPFRKEDLIRIIQEQSGKQTLENS